MIADLAGRQRSLGTSTNAFVAAGQKARLLSDRTLVAAEAAGFAVVIAVLAWAPDARDLALPAAAVGALGLWGVTDHMLEARRRLFKPLRLMLSGFHSLVAAVGIAAAIAAGYALLGRIMGTFVF